MTIILCVSKYWMICQLIINNLRRMEIYDHWPLSDLANDRSHANHKIYTLSLPIGNNCWKGKLGFPLAALAVWRESSFRFFERSVCVVHCYSYSTAAQDSRPGADVQLLIKITHCVLIDGRKIQVGKCSYLLAHIYVIWTASLLKPCHHIANIV